MGVQPPHPEDTVDAPSEGGDADGGRRDAEQPSPEPRGRAGCARVILLDANPLRRHAYAALFATTLPEVAVSCGGGASEIFDLDPDCRGSVRAVVLSVGDLSLEDQDVAGEIMSMRRLLPNVPLAVLSDREGGQEIAGALASEIRGYIPTSHPPSLAAAAINLVLAGGIYVPPVVIEQAQAGKPSGGASPERGAHRLVRDASQGGGAPLSQRQAEVLRLLQQGKPNKIIAHELDMRESTVKVHVHEIMKKLNATNRTELAYLASQAPSPT